MINKKSRWVPGFVVIVCTIMFFYGIVLAAEETLGIDSKITLGNLLTILAIIGGGFANVFVISGKMTKFITMTEMRFQAGDKKFIEYDKDIESLQKQCESCPQAMLAKDRVTKLEAERERMNTEQIRVRAEWPVRLTNIENSVNNMQADMNTVRIDVNAIKNKLIPEQNIEGHHKDILR